MGVPSEIFDLIDSGIELCGQALTVQYHRVKTLQGMFNLGLEHLGPGLQS
jgi:hypothetical protein